MTTNVTANPVTILHEKNHSFTLVSQMCSCKHSLFQAHELSCICHTGSVRL